MIAGWAQLAGRTVGAAATPSGRVSWREFVESFRQTAAAQLDMLPAIGIGASVLVLLWVNWRVAKRLSASWEARRGGAARHP